MQTGDIYKLKEGNQVPFIIIFKIVNLIRPNKYKVLIIESREKTIMSHAALNENYILDNYELVPEA